MLSATRSIVEKMLRAAKFLLHISVCMGSLLAASLGAQEPASSPGPIPPGTVKVSLSPEKPLPNLQSLIARAKEHQSANDEIAKNYTFKRTFIADDFDNKGTKKGTHTNEYQVFFVKNWRISQHIARDGKQLSESDAKKEQERVDNDVREIKEGKKKEPKEGVNIRVSELLKVAAFSNARRELIDDRPTIVFDYQGDPRAKTSDLSQVIMQKLAGTLWIDEEDAAIRRMIGHLNENYRYGGILVNIKKGSWFDLQQTQVNNEIWFSKSFDAHVDGRILLFKGLDSDIHQRSSDYRKMRTSATLLPGSQVIGEDGKPIPNLEAEPRSVQSPQVPVPATLPK